MLKTEDKTQIDAEKLRWANRRRMAWMSLISMILFTAILIFYPIPKDRLEIIKEFIIWYYFTGATVIGAYMGATTWAYLKR